MFENSPFCSRRSSRAFTHSLSGPNIRELEEIGHGELARLSALWEPRASSWAAGTDTELTSFCNRPTRPRPRCGHRQGLACGPCHRPDAVLTAPTSRRARPPSGCRTTAGSRPAIPDPRSSVLRLGFSTSLAGGVFTATLLPTIGMCTGDAVVRVELSVGERGHTHQLRPIAVPTADPSSCPGGGSAATAGQECWRRAARSLAA